MEVGIRPANISSELNSNWAQHSLRQLAAPEIVGPLLATNRLCEPKPAGRLLAFQRRPGIGYFYPEQAIMAPAYADIYRATADLIQ